MDYDSLRELEHDDVKRFTLEGKEKFGKVLSVYDGDTCDVAFCTTELLSDDDSSDNDMDCSSNSSDELESTFVRYNCRMASYDAPELGKPNGKLSRDYLAHLCTGGKPDLDFDDDILTKKELQDKLNESKALVFAKFAKEGKYGRPVVTLYQTKGTKTPRKSKQQSINHMMWEFVCTKKGFRF